MTPDFQRKLFWDYRSDIPVEEIPGQTRAQRFVDFWPEIHKAYKMGVISLDEVKSIIEVIHQYGPVKYCEDVREYVIGTLIQRWI